MLGSLSIGLFVTYVNITKLQFEVDSLKKVSRSKEMFY